MNRRGVMRTALAGLATVVCAIAASIATQDLPPEPSVQLPADLQRVLTGYELRWRAHDAHGLAQLFAPDGYVLAEQHPPAKGREAIEKVYEHAGGPLALRALAYATDGKIAYIIGCFAKQKGELDAGKFTLTLRKAESGEWLIVSDMDNSNH